ncbi:ABC transporter permease [Actinomadura craniellae]|uniref:ABC transporter permease n=1 Tax=Actinomadura craniellae TaxID=2231787 RepID=A0A365H3M8_9ACTN|nr:ABC transporter permease [Actinomadura craniellae]RAY13707.1 ABC transporter permease [Actinomadura craniellae]
MFVLALSSLRHRTAAFTAGFLALFLGAALVMTFGSLVDTALGPGVDPVSEEVLAIMGGVVGGWSLLLVVFAVASTTTLGVHQRAREIALLKSAGATPGQLTWMILAEVLVLALVAVVPAVPLGMLAGRTLLGLLQDSGQVGAGIHHAFGPVALGQGIGVTLCSAVGAALITARRAVRTRVTESLLNAAAPRARLTRRRVAFGLLFFAGAVNQAVLTVTVGRGTGFQAQQYAGSADILFAIGLACFAPAIVRRLPLPGFGVVGAVTRQNLRSRSAPLAAALTPIVLFIGVGVGTLYMQSLDNRASAGRPVGADQHIIETLNYVVTGMIALFLCIMLINTLVASTAERTREFAQYRLAGATSGQVLSMVALESLAITVAGTVLGTVASLVTILPFAYARTGTWTPDLDPGTYLAAVGFTAVLTFATALLTARRSLSVPTTAAVTV